jgi:TPR repeat protein
LGYVYYNKINEEGHFIKSRYWYERLLERVSLKNEFSVNACVNLGVIYDTGNGVDKNVEKARELYEIAAIKGKTSAEFNLNLLFKYKNAKMEENCFIWYEKNPITLSRFDILNLKSLYEKSILSENTLLYKLFVKQQSIFKESILKMNSFCNIQFELI